MGRFLSRVLLLGMPVILALSSNADAFVSQL